jgi:hypothetical protein
MAEQPVSNSGDGGQRKMSSGQASGVAAGLDAMAALVWIWFNPVRAARAHRGDWTWVWPWLAVSIGSMTLSYFTAGLADLAMQLSLPDASVPGSNAADAMQVARRFQIAGLWATPVWLLVKWGVSTGLLTWLSVVANIQVRGSRVFFLVVLCGGVTLIGDVMGFVVLSLSEAPRTLADLSPKVGLNALIRSTDPAISALTAWVSIPNLLYYGILADGLAAFAAVSLARASVVVGLIAVLNLAVGMVGVLMATQAQ